MKTKCKSRLWILLFAIIVVVGILPLTMKTVSAADGLTPDSKYGENGKILFTVDDSGVLTWSAVPDATSYDLSI